MQQTLAIDKAWEGWETLTPVLRYANFHDALPGSRFGPRYISDFQVLLVQSGNGNATIGESCLSIAAGDLVFYGPNTCHSVTSSVKEPLRLLGLHFVFRQQDIAGINADCAAHVRDEPIDVCSAAPFCPLDPVPPPVTHPRDSGALRGSMEALVLCYIASPFGRQIEKRGLLLLMINAWRVALNQSAVSETIRSEIAAAAATLSTQYANPPSLETLAASAGLSADHFGRLFKRQTGLSVRRHLSRQRLIEAKRLLVQGELNVAEVARAVGYDDAFYFSRVFHREFGVAPTHFRGRYPLI